MGFSFKGAAQTVRKAANGAAYKALHSVAWTYGAVPEAPSRADDERTRDLENLVFRFLRSIYRNLQSASSDVDNARRAEVEAGPDHLWGAGSYHYDSAQESMDEARGLLDRANWILGEVGGSLTQEVSDAARAALDELKWRANRVDPSITVPNEAVRYYFELVLRQDESDQGQD